MDGILLARDDASVEEANDADADRALYAADKWRLDSRARVASMHKRTIFGNEREPTRRVKDCTR
jgi:hypothetical protein